MDEAGNVGGSALALECTLQPAPRWDSLPKQQMHPSLQPLVQSRSRALFLLQAETLLAWVPRSCRLLWRVDKGLNLTLTPFSHFHYGVSGVPNLEGHLNNLRCAKHLKHCLAHRGVDNWLAINIIIPATLPLRCP